MKNYIIRRIIQMIPVFIGILFILFFILEQAPGTPVSNMMIPKMTPEQKAELAQKLGLDVPWYERFVNWIGEALHGNLGYSINHKKPVVDVMKDYVGPTLLLSLVSLAISVIIGIPAGVISATKQYSITDNVLTVVSFIGISIPSFFFGLLLLKNFAVDIQIFPLFGLKDPLLMSTNPVDKALDVAWHLVLPSIVLGLGSTASFMRYTRSSMLEVIKQDYIRTARAKGLKEKTVIYRHAFRNAVIPIITLLGFWIPSLLSGAVVTESIFALPGLGKISVEATMTRNYPLILGINAMLAVLTLMGTLVADILYAIADPRIRYD
ncbi:Dipeptide transport system permease protein DppB [bioreactor metagenome]|jgi:peptide/nickel transport system permease protein|uniref:Peptide/nickel transport system permease protein n=2 Tax=root TaxID=1 RepID=A0A562J0V0_9FIRM|nr:MULTISPECIES: ABC transporter permease [Sedimentibacter]MEA5096104.1 ABC transporter permease [Sedimentibacter saalensis]TWH76921.1 peptide/nickel transport system permease protein [Sedimentibacter saalensis]